MSQEIKNFIIFQEAKGFITNTNRLYSTNNGPFPNTALQYTEGLLAAYVLRKRKENGLQSLLTFRKYYGV